MVAERAPQKMHRSMRAIYGHPDITLREAKVKNDRATERAEKRATRRWRMVGRSFTPSANHGMFSPQSGVISLKEHKPVCC